MTVDIYGNRGFDGYDITQKFTDLADAIVIDKPEISDILLYGDKQDGKSVRNLWMDRTIQVAQSLAVLNDILPHQSVQY